MSNYFIVIAADAHKRRLYLPSAYELTRYRLGRDEWGLKVLTRNRTKFRSGDQLLFYISGNREKGRHFVAQAECASEANLNRSGAIVDAPNFSDSICSEYKLKTKNARFFKTPVNISDLVNDLHVIPAHRKALWWVFFQGGTLRIPEHDFDLIVSRGNQSRCGSLKPSRKAAR